ncbi:DegQ family serine endoprotease [Jiella avicenniae]|uniref:DegQ family serine endoprotease n=1 Tax=Jiella avicenniae TaxID=2907202 RepID=A0A9X1P319_9HYPH|nr:DegQ family serine endoprotease [Jiella avicenniae]MCE7028371.1 DegQ family serine endoprotease [Jiella avicenniae]
MRLKFLALAAVLLIGTAFAVPSVLTEGSSLHRLLASSADREPVRLARSDDSLRQELRRDEAPRWDESDAAEPESKRIQIAEAESSDRIPSSAAEIKLSFAPLVKTTAPAVVNVYAARKVAARRSPFADDPFFGQFFGNRFDNPPRMEQSLGSGVIVDPSGLVVTNNHVVEDADEVKVAFADGREFDTKVVSKDATVDLAVLKIDGDGPFATIPIADSDDLQTGDLVLAIGNPFGIGQTVTNGIVSALARNHIGVNDFGFFIQTDAAINPGNSGGALIDMSGRLVGVNTAIFSRSGGSNGIGFAIPSNMVSTFVRAAENGGRYERPFIGADFAPVTADIAEALGLPRPTGALVRSVYPDGPAAKVGLKVGDVVMKADGKEVATPDALNYRFATRGIGQNVELAVLSADETEDLTLPLEQAPETPPRDERAIDGRNPFAGATVYNLSPRVAGEFQLPQDATGVVVAKVAPRSLAARFGLQPGDILLEVNGESVETTESLVAIAGEDYRGWQFDIERGGRRLTQVVR